MTGQLQLDVVVPGTVNPAAGERAKTAGMTSAAQATAPTWADACDAAIRLMARRGLPFQAADLITEGLIDEPDHPSQWGPRFGAAARAGVIRLHSYRPSKRATVHRSICKTWIGSGEAP
ncbi:hypothetical protein [Streptomyces sp. NRRL S-1868]|uniref:hypothetical protein n=1 Tax=Streptomyces sp. NRRL S-1868 TaxID=1463892 RepID=UPI0004C89665|nr:hypothetical protein [Streptomyces sp. NRRL S-1868]